jgi:membrane protease YdiL (CAAX protease family)
MTSDPALPQAPGLEDEALALSAARLRATDAVGGAMREGLLRWTIVLAAASFGTLALGHMEGAVLMAMAGMFALAQSWDVRDRALTGDPIADVSVQPGGVGSALRMLVPMVAPLAGAVLYTGLAVYARTLQVTAASIGVMQWCTASALVCVLAAFPPIQQQLALVFTRGAHPGHTARLTAALALVVLLLPYPMQLLLPQLTESLSNTGKPLADVGGLVGQLVGEVLFALAAIGLWVGRDAQQARERLGLGGMNMRHVIIAAIGLAAVIGVNAGMEHVERTQFHDLWLRDQAMVKLIAAELSLTAMLVLGVSAGVGEEVLVRGALQPRVGLVWASLLFAAGHVQYTWFGMLTIMLLGITLGLIRKYANTTTAIVVHGLYDIIAAFGARSAN